MNKGFVAELRCPAIGAPLQGDKVRFRKRFRATEFGGAALADYDPRRPLSLKTLRSAAAIFYECALRHVGRL